MPRPPREVQVFTGRRLPIGGSSAMMMGDPFLGGLLRAIGGGLRRLAPIGLRALGLTVPSIPRAPMGHGSSGIPQPPVFNVPGRRPGGGVGQGTIVISPPGGFIPPSGAGGVATGMRRRRRMNPLNPRALRRSLRRVEGFRRFALRAGFVPRGTRVKKIFPFKRRRRAA